MRPQPENGIYLHDDGDDDLANFGDDEPIGVTNEQLVLIVSFESVQWDADRRQALEVEDQARSQALAMRRPYEMLALATIHCTTHEEVVVARWREQPRVDRENWELVEVAASMAATEAMVARDMAFYQAVKDATRATEASEAKARWNDALPEGKARHQKEDASNAICRQETFTTHMHGRQGTPVANRPLYCE
jgi:hypothetical protein